jgi:GT2 family glycosyltransferase
MEPTTNEPPDPRVSVVVLTCNRAAELMRTLDRLRRLPERPRLVVVDNGSRDDTALRLARRFPSVERVDAGGNRGAAGRNEGVARVDTPYVAFCDDDTWWAPGALKRAADILDAHPRVGVVAARVLVGEDERLDPACQRMATSPLDATGLPGPSLVAFMAGAAVMRTAAFRAAGGYEPRLFLGAEEALLGLDLLARGWRIVYAADVVTHHHPSPARNARRRRVLLARNRLWIAWLRLPWAQAWAETAKVLRGPSTAGVRGAAAARALLGLPWVLRRRSPVPTEVAEMHRRVFGPAPPAAARPAEWRRRIGP